MKFKFILLSVFLVFAFAKAVSGQTTTLPTHTKISAELDITYTFKKKDNGLTLYINGEALAPITPIMENLFNVAGYIIFDFTKDQQEFRTSAGRVQNVRFVKK